MNIDLLIGQIKEASRAVHLATIEIVELRKRVDQLEKENERLRVRLAAQARLIRRIEGGEL